MKKFLIILLVLIMITLTACNNRAEIEEMDMDAKVRYALYLDFILQIYIDGQWLNLTQDSYLDGNSISMVLSLIDPEHESFADFYTEIRFVHSWEETAGHPTNVIAAFPFGPARTGVVNALNWEVDSAGMDLSEFGLSYPITVENLVDDYENINRLVWHDARYTVDFRRFVSGLTIAGIVGTQAEWDDLQQKIEDGMSSPMFSPDDRIIFELLRIGEEITIRTGGDSDENVEKVLVILDQLNMTQDEAGPLLRAAGSFEAFITVTDLMLAQGLSAEDALAQVARE